MTSVSQATLADKLDALQQAVDSAALILNRDGILPLEGQAFTQTEREVLEALASEDVRSVLADATETD